MKIKNGLSSIIVLLVLWLVMPAMAQMAGLGSKLPSPMMTAALDGSPRLDARGAYISFQPLESSGEEEAYNMRVFNANPQYEIGIMFGRLNPRNFFGMVGDWIYGYRGFINNQRRADWKILRPGERVDVPFTAKQGDEFRLVVARKYQYERYFVASLDWPSSSQGFSLSEFIPALAEVEVNINELDSDESDEPETPQAQVLLRNDGELGSSTGIGVGSEKILNEILQGQKEILRSQTESNERIGDMGATLLQYDERIARLENAAFAGNNTAGGDAHHATKTITSSAKSNDGTTVTATATATATAAKSKTEAKTPVADVNAKPTKESVEAAKFVRLLNEWRTKNKVSIVTMATGQALTDVRARAQAAEKGQKNPAISNGFEWPKSNCTSASAAAKTLFDVGKYPALNKDCFLNPVYKKVAVHVEEDSWGFIFLK